MMLFNVLIWTVENPTRADKSASTNDLIYLFILMNLPSKYYHQVPIDKSIVLLDGTTGVSMSSESYIVDRDKQRDL